MQVILHSGVHFTDEGRFLKAMQRNAPLLREVGVAIPGPSRYRTLLSEAAHRLAGGTPAPEAREVLLDGLLDEDWGGIDRIILSHPNFFSVPRLAMQGGVVYRKAEERIDVITGNAVFKRGLDEQVCQKSLTNFPMLTTV